VIDFSNTERAFAYKSNAELKKAYWLFKLVGNNQLVKNGKVLTELALKLNIPISWAVKPTIYSHFCGGENINDCQKTGELLWKYRVGTILDYSVEGKEEESNFDATAAEIIKTIEKAKSVDYIPFSVFKTTGVCRFSILEKVSSGISLSHEEAISFEKAKTRVKNICQTAFNKQVRIFIDAEESWIQPAIDAICEEMMLKFNKKEAIVYNTLQMYRVDRLQYLMETHSKMKAQQVKLGVKIVRGAYMEKERKRAIQMNYPSPIQPDKASCDRDYDAALIYCIENIEDIAICAGTHNENSSKLLAQLIDKYAIPHQHPHIYFAQLLGMSNHISFNLSAAGYNTAKYVPYGKVKEVLPYLIRRAEENTSVAGQTGRELNLITQELKRRKL
jgi:proline dehydrogenase